MLDVFIVGGGPAGATAAHLLASWGWSVLVVNRAPGARPRLAESLPPSARKLLAFLGQLDAVDQARFHPNLGNIGRWAGEPLATDADTPGLHVPRAAFDRVLRGVARRSGARIVDGLVRSIALDDPVDISYVTAGGKVETCQARRVLDCSGRAGVIAGRGLQRDQPGYRTLAITSEWECDGRGAAESTHTLVESYRDGWAWSVPLSATRRQCTVMVDPGTSRTPGRADLGIVYGRELAKTCELGARLAAARQISRPWASSASLHHAQQPAEGEALLVGDAASFIEPLSSAGVKKALMSAWRAAVVTNTCLLKPYMADAARTFYIRREAEVYAECRRRSHRFFGEAAAAYGTAFWSVRASGTADQTGDPGPRSAEELVRDPNVQQAFDRLRRAPSVRLRPTAALRVEPTATIEGREVVLRDALALPDVESPVRFAAGVNLPALAGLAAQCDGVSSLIAAYHTQVGPAPVPGLLAGLSLLVAHRGLVDEGSSL